MAEVLGVASGIAGLLSLTIEVFGISYRYITEVQGASGDVHRFLEELESLKSVLINIDRLSKQINHVEIFGEGDSSLLSAAQSNKYLELLENIRKSLERRAPDGSFRRKIKALTWPFSGEKTMALIDSLHRHLEIYNISLIYDATNVECEDIEHHKNHVIFCEL